MIKSTNTALYRWIEEYSAAYASTAGGRAHISQSAIAADDDLLRSILAAENRVLQDEIFSLANHLPGIRQMSLTKEEKAPLIWGDEGQQARDAAVVGRRLSSPDHYRLFFALAVPSIAPQDKDYQDLESTLFQSPDKLEKLFLDWSADKSSLGVSRIELVFERLNGGGRALNVEQFEKFWLAIADIFDSALSETILDVWGNPKLWPLARPIITNGFRDMPSKRRERLLRTAFATGRALCWLADFFRDELYAHGRIDDERSHGQPALTAEDLDFITPIIMARFAKLGARRLLSLKNGQSNLLAWAQGAPNGANNPARIDVERLVKTDRDMIEILEQLCSRTYSVDSQGIPRFNRYLSRGLVSRFFDFDSTKAKLEGINNGRKSQLRDRAAALLQDIENANRW